MGRLQDFPPVTPAAADNILIVQSTGQGLASVGSTLGAKMDKTNPTGTGSLSINRMSGTTEGGYSVATGYQATASGAYSQASGYRTVATGTSTSAFGTETIANHAAQHVFGMYNLADTSTAQPTSKGNYIEIVGKGVSNESRSNARTLDWSGNEVLAGGLKINGNQDVVTGISESILTTSTTGTQSLITGKNLANYRFVLICLESGYVLYDTSLIPYNLFKTGFSLLTRVDSSNYARITYASDTTITVNQLAGSYSLRIYGVK